MSDPPKTTEATQPEAAPLGDVASSEGDHETQPAVEKPIGGRYMPLCRAVLWVATKGGAVTATSGDKERWEAANQELLNALSSGKIRCVGEKEGEGEIVPTEKWVNCRINFVGAAWSYDDFSDELYLSNEMHLRTYAVLGMDDWPNGVGDVLMNRDKRWTKLMVPGEEVLGCWSFEAEAPGTGAPGRPTKSMHLIEAEHRSRLNRGDALESLAAEAEALLTWLRTTYPANPPPKPKTIMNRLRIEHRRHFAKRPKL